MLHERDRLFSPEQEYIVLMDMIFFGTGRRKFYCTLLRRTLILFHF